MEAHKMGKAAPFQASYVRVLLGLRFCSYRTSALPWDQGETTSLQGGVMASWPSTKHLHGEEQEIDSCWRHTAAGDRSLCLPT